MTIYRQDEQNAPYAGHLARADPSYPSRPAPAADSGLVVQPRPRRYLDWLFDDIRAQIEAEPEVVAAALHRRDVVLTAAMTLVGVIMRFASGSLAHGTAICPIHRRDHGLDADCGISLDPHLWPTLGPETVYNEGPERVLEYFLDGVLAVVRQAGFPRATATITKRAILLRFHAPLPSGEDPTVDLIVGLPRAAGGLWIPNTEQHRWDPSDPQGHTRLFNGVDGPTAHTITWAQTTRLTKAENKRTDPPALCSFNVEALAWLYLHGAPPLPEALLAVWRGGASDLARRLTPDPAGVSKPIKVADRQAAAERWQNNAQRLEAALDPRASDVEVRRLLRPLWPDYVPDEITGVSKARTAVQLQKGKPLHPALAGGVAVSSSRPAVKPTRAYGRG